MLTTAVALAIVTSQVPADARKGYADILRTYVENGRVDYKALAANDLGKLDGYLAAVAKAELPKGRDARISFWFDAYNALVLRAVITEGRPRSVLDVRGFFDTKLYTVAGTKSTLNDLEKKQLNPFANDPRTHMALVCGAVGCPILEREPYFGSDLDRRLDAATRRYLASKTGAMAEPGVLKVSKLFDWYKADFGGPQGARAFVVRHLSTEAKQRLGAKSVVIFIDYNWTLNQR